MRTDSIPIRLARPSAPPAIVALLALTLALVACGNGDGDPTASPAPTPTTAAPASPTPAGATPTPGRFPTTLPFTPVPSPSATATATATTPSLTPSPTRAAVEPPPDQGVDLPEVALDYAIEATLSDFDSGVVEAVSVVTIENEGPGPLDLLFFRVAPAFYGSFALDSLTREGAPVETVGSDGGTTLEARLDPPLAPGATTALRFAFRVPVRETGDGFASISRDGVVLRLGYWYPMVSNDAGYPPLLDPPYTLVADYRVVFTAPADVVVAAAGAETAPPVEMADGVRREYALEQGRDFALMLSRAYELDERVTASGIVVRQYTIPSLYGGSSDDARRQLRDRAFRTAERSLDEFTANIGPYPWPALALVEGGPGLGGGIEYASLTIISYDSGGLELLVAHEIAHMWFYAVIGTRTQDDPWIDEGAATFLAGGIVTNGDYGITSDRGTINYVAPLNTSIPDLTGYSGAEWITAIYTQAGSFFADVYLALGEDAFWNAMRDIYASQAYEIATPWEVLTIFQAHSPDDLTPLYERYFTYDWLDDVGT